MVQGPADHTANPNSGHEARPKTGHGRKPEAHEKSDQVILVVEGELSAEIGGKHYRMKAGDVIIIPPRVKHKFTNSGEEPAVTFNVYSPPEYPVDEK